MQQDSKIDKEVVARSFQKGQKSYDKHATIQQQVAGHVISLLRQAGRTQYSHALEIGCGTGSLTALIVGELSPEVLYVNDIVCDFFTGIKGRIDPETKTELLPLCGDIEEIELPKQLDLVSSSATFQWLTDLEGLFHKISASLKGDGVLAFSIFGPSTLVEFKTITGIGLEYHSLSEVEGMLAKAGFAILAAETIKDKKYLPTPREVLRHLQLTGVSGVTRYRWTRDALRRFEASYSDLFGGPDGVPVSYESFCLIARRKERS